MALGVWTSKGVTLAPRESHVLKGWPYELIAFGGWTDAGGAYLLSCETWNGVTWGANNNMLVTVASHAGAGHKNKTLSFGGFTGSVTTDETYYRNGTSWVLGSALPAAVRNHGGAGEQLAALCFGGLNSTGTVQDATLNYNGTAWSTNASALLAPRTQLGGTGTDLDTLCFGGVYGVLIKTAETWNGTVWSSAADISIVNRYIGGAGNASAGLATGGDTTNSTPATTEIFDGVAWSLSSSLLEGRGSLGSAGSSEVAVVTGGYVYGVGTSDTHEEFNLHTVGVFKYSAEVIVTPKQSFITFDLAHVEAGDLVLVFIAKDGANNPVASDAGWSLKVANTSNGAVSISLWNHASAAGTTATWTSGSEEWVGIAFAVKNGDITTVATVGSRSGTDALPVTPGITAATLGQFIITGFAADNGQQPHVLDSRLVSMVSAETTSGGAGAIGMSAGAFMSRPAWTVTSTLTKGKLGAGGVGSATDAMCFGGDYGGNQSDGENFNGVAWSAASGNLSIARQSMGSVGVPLNALFFGGHFDPGDITPRTESYDGVAWTTESSLPVSLMDTAYANSATNAFCLGGKWGSSEDNEVYLYNGTVWALDSYLLQVESGHSCIGSGASIISLGGDPYNGRFSTEAYDGLSWSIDKQLSVDRALHSSVGTTSDGLAYGGDNGVFLETSEEFDGITWLTGSLMVQAKSRMSSAGIASDALAIGGSSGYTEVQGYAQVNSGTGDFLHSMSSSDQWGGITATVQTNFIPPVVYDVAITEAVTSAESSGAVASYPVALSEIVVAGEVSDGTVSTSGTYAGEIVEVANATEVETTTVGLAVEVTEPANATEVETSDISKDVVITESAPATEVETATAVVNASSLETAVASEESSSTREVSGALVETAIPVDIASAISAAVASVSEQATAVEVQAAVYATLVAISESASATDSSSATEDYPVSISESVTATEAITAVPGYSMAIQESASATEVSGKSVTFTRAITEGVTATEEAGGSAVLIGEVTEIVVATDSSDYANIVTGVLTEAAMAMDSQTLESILIAASIEEQANATEVSDSLGSTQFVHVAESAEAVDNYEVTWVTWADIAEAVTATEVVSGSIGYVGIRRANYAEAVQLGSGKVDVALRSVVSEMIASRTTSKVCYKAALVSPLLLKSQQNNILVVSEQYASPVYLKSSTLEIPLKGRVVLMSHQAATSEVNYTKATPKVLHPSFVTPLHQTDK